MTGLGKTLAAWCAVAAMPDRDVLIVCPKGATPQWRRTIALAGLPEKAVTLINYERCKSLMALVDLHDHAAAGTVGRADLLGVCSARRGGVAPRRGKPGAFVPLLREG